MSNLQTTNKLPKTCLIAGLFLCVIAAFAPFSLAQAFQVRQGDSLRVMQSKPYAQSTNFRVNADMFIQPSAKINIDDTVAQVVVTPPAPPVVVTPTPVPTNTGSSSGCGGQRYSADKWLLERKYNELVKQREEQNGSFLTSAPESPELKFDYVPTRPSDVKLIKAPQIVVTPQNSAPTPEVAPSKSLISTFKAAVLPTPVTEESPERVVMVERPEAALLSAPMGPDVTVVSLNTRQKQKLLTASDSKLAWLWGADEVTEERWQAAAPKEVAAPTCVGCADVLWMQWCVFVALCLLLILIFVILIFVMQIMVLRLRADRHKPDNPRTLKYRMKKLFKQFGLLSLCLVSVSLTAQAQTSTPQTLIYEGELLDDTGVPVLGSYTFRFSFWDNGDYEATDVAAGLIDAGATDYRGWTEVQTTTTLSDGSFSLLLGDVTPLTAGLFDQDNMYLQVEVKASTDPDTAYEFVDINLSDPTDDRKIIASVPFAFNANKLDYRDLGFGAGNIPYLDLAGLLPESVIPDLNLTSDDLDLADITLSDFTNDLALNDGQIFVGDATNVAAGVAVSGDATIDNTGAFTITTDAVGDDEIDYTNVTLADFTNDVGFVTTDTDTLSGLTCGVGEVAKWNGSAWVCGADDGGSAFTASDGITLTGSNFTNDFGTTIEGSEITDGTIGGADLNFGDITLADFTNDAGFLTTVDISDDTNLTAGAGATLTDDEISVNVGDTIETTEITDGTITAADLNLADITLTDFTNDAGFITSDTLDDLSCGLNEIAKWNGAAWACAPDGGNTYTAGSGLTLVGTEFSNNLGDTIEEGEITDNAVTLAKIGTAGAVDADKILTTDAVGAPQWEDKTNFATSAQGALADSALQSGDNVSELTNDSGYLTTVDVSANTNLTAGTGITLIDDTLSVNLGTSIDAAEINTDAVNDDEINYANVTLADFTNDAGFVTTDNDTTYTGGTGITLTGTVFSNDLGTTIEGSEITDGTVTGADLDLADITLSDFTNDAGFVTTDTDTTYNAGIGMNLVGTTFSSTLGTFIDSTELAANSVGDNALDYTQVTLNDFTNDTGFITADTLDGLSCASGEVVKWNGSAWVCAPDAGGASYTASDGITLTGSNFTNDFGNSIESNEITNGTIGDQDLDLADITLADFTNDAGFLTTDSDTLDSLTCAADEIARFNGTVWECAGGPTSVTEVLGVRSASLIFDADGTNNTGSMYEEEATTLSGILDNVLRWFSRQSVLNDYDIIVQWTVPSDFDSFEPNPISLDYQTDGTVTDAVIDMTVKHNTDVDDELVGTGIGLNSNTWATTNFNIDGTTTWLPGETMKIRLKMQAKDSNSAQIGNIKIKYKRK